MRLLFGNPSTPGRTRIFIRKKESKLGHYPSFARPAHPASAKMAAEPVIRNASTGARFSRAKENQSEAKYDFGSAGNSRNRDDPARFDQHSLVLNHHLIPFTWHRKVRVNQRDHAQHNEQNSEHGVKRDFHPAARISPCTCRTRALPGGLTAAVSHLSPRLGR
jgi:hypothetical protein